jgi:hypothetical protein
MAAFTRDGVGPTDRADERAFEISADDVFSHIAAVTVSSHQYMDYLHVAKIGETWLIVNALCELRGGEMSP